MAYFLGMDGGGTQTTAAVSDERGRVLAQAVTGPSNPLKVGFNSSQHELLRAARQALRKARVKPREVNAVCVGLAGVDRPPVHRRLLSWLRRSVPARSYLLTSDAAIALEAAVGNRPGVIVISGTGSIAYARDARGRVSRSGGWGLPFDDVGSGYDLGRGAIVAALRALDGRGPHTILTPKLRRALRLRNVTQVILRRYTPAEIAALAPLVQEVARSHDRVALALCDQAGRDLAELAAALLKRLGWLRRSVPIVCAGGVFASSAKIRRAFAQRLHHYAPRARVALLRRPAVEGALALARHLNT